MPVGPNGPPPIIISGGIIGAGASNPPVQAISPGAIVSIFGANFSPPGIQRMVTGTDVISGKLPTNLGDLRQHRRCQCAHHQRFPQPDQCSGSRPAAGSGNRQGDLQLRRQQPRCRKPWCSRGYQRLAGVLLPTPDPVSGRSLIAATTSNGVIEVYGTGWGATSPTIPPGAVPGTSAAQLAAPMELMLGGVPVLAANILYAGISPCCAGLYQLDFTIPDGTPPGNLPLVITIDGSTSPCRTPTWPCHRNRMQHPNLLGSGS